MCLSIENVVRPQINVAQCDSLLFAISFTVGRRG
jgi:hypothetical protein